MRIRNEKPDGYDSVKDRSAATARTNEENESVQNGNSRSDTAFALECMKSC